MSDVRTVHGRSMSGEWEIVRYDRAGKWFVERGEERMRVTVDHAARIASVGSFTPGVPGGRLFDARVRRLRSEMPSPSRSYTSTFEATSEVKGVG